MKNVYVETEAGWVLVFKEKSFEHACEVAVQMQAKSGKNHCVNS